MADTSYYDILGVDKSATADEIKRAYKKKAIQYHPDRQGDKSEAEKKKAEDMFRQCAEAYDVLRDPQKRQQYDQFGKAAFENNGGFGGGAGGFSGMDINDILRGFGFDFGDMFGQGRRGGHRGRPQYRGDDLRLQVSLTLEEIAKGTTKKFRLKKDVTCHECGGSGVQKGSSIETCTKCGGSGYVITQRNSIFGVMQSQEVCPNCHGEGTIIKDKCSCCHGTGVEKGEEILEVNIPAGVAEGMVIPVKGKGNAAPHNGMPGDVHVYVKETPHKEFVRDEQDLIYNLLLTVPQAALGETITVPTLDGAARLNIPAGTQPGTRMRLRGKGLPAVQGYGYGTGDIIINISVYIPESLSDKERKAFESMRESSSMKGNKSIKEKIFNSFRNYFS